MKVSNIDTSRLQNDMATRKICLELAVKTGRQNYSEVIGMAAILEFYIVNGIGDIQSLANFAKDVETSLTMEQGLKQ